VISALPRLRRDLTLSQQETAGEASLVVKDPQSGRFFRLGPTERFIAEQLDGQTSLEVIRRRTEERFDAKLPPETLSAFLQNLEKGGLLQSEEHEGEPTARAKRVRGSLLYLRVPLFDPDRLFTRLARRLRWMFTLPFLLVSGAVTVIALGIVMANGSELAHQFVRLYRIETLPLFFVILLVTATAHEFGHGVTCKHFGGEVHEVGFLLMYFQPGFYCNVSDAWLFPERAKRLWVGFAGLYFELSVWALATVAWRLTETDTWINYVALTVMAVSGVKSLFELNPFLKLDGYYLLSDYLGIPNLRARSFRYVGDRLSRLFGFGSAAPITIPRREQRVYLVYGSVATVSSFALLGYALARTGGRLLESHSIAGLILLTSVVGVASARRLRGLFGGPGKNSTGTDPAPAGTAVAAATPGRRVKPRRLAWMIIAVAGLAFILFGHRQLRVAGSFDVLPEHNADVRASVTGIIQEILVDEGTAVKAGDLIARLSDRELRADLLRSEAEVKATRANVDRLESGPRIEEIRIARVAVSKAKDGVAFAQSKLTRSKTMFDRELLSRQDLEEVQRQAAEANNALAEAQARLSGLVRGTRPEEIEAARAQLGGLESQRQFLEQQLELLNIVSPVTGVVATPSRELRTMRGQLVTKGALIAKVYEVKVVTAQITIPEKEISDIHVGYPVRLRSRAYPNTVFDGRVTAIATAAQGSLTPSAVAPPAAVPVTDDRRTFIVTTQIANQGLLLKPGMTGQAKVYCGDRRVLELIGRRLARTFKVEFWSWL